MIITHVNWLAIVVAAVINIVVGFVWYSDSVFGKAWMALAKVGKPNRAEMKKQMPKLMLASIILALITSYVLALFIQITSLTRFGSFGC